MIMGPLDLTVGTCHSLGALAPWPNWPCGKSGPDHNGKSIMQILTSRCYFEGCLHPPWSFMGRLFLLNSAQFVMNLIIKMFSIAHGQFCIKSINKFPGYIGSLQYFTKLHALSKSLYTRLVFLVKQPDRLNNLS